MFLIQDTISKNITFSQKNLKIVLKMKIKFQTINLVKLDEFIENLKEKGKLFLMNVSKYLRGQAQR